jgi:hypothetical protein
VSEIVTHTSTVVGDALTSMRNCKTLEVRFRTLLTQDETEQLEVVRAQRIVGSLLVSFYSGV